MYYLSVLYEKLLITIGYIFKGKIRGNSIESPIFIVSAGRSGSTLLRKFLIQTGQFIIPPESGDFIPSAIKIYVKNILFPWAVRKIKIMDLIRASGDLGIWNLDLNELEIALDHIPQKEKNLASIIKTIYRQYAIKNSMLGPQIWGDKTPYLIYRLSWIYLLFPEATVIHMVRDPRAVILSRKREFGDSISYAINRWKWSVKCISEMKKKYNIKEIKFEDLLLRPKTTMIDLLHHISGHLIYAKKNTNIILDDDHLSHHRNLHQPLLKNKISEWKRYLPSEDKEYIDRMLFKEMGTYGYKV